MRRIVAAGAHRSEERRNDASALANNFAGIGRRAGDPRPSWPPTVRENAAAGPGPSISCTKPAL
jgi:hypothetical protein